MPSVEEGAREMRREYVFVPVTCAFTSAPCSISRSMSAMFAGPPALVDAARPVPRPPVPTPAATRNGVRPIALMLGLAPLSRRSRTTSTSLAMVARSNGVHPVL